MIENDINEKPPLLIASVSDSDIEQWSDIDDFEYYQVSTFGNIKILDKWVNSKNGNQKLAKGRILKLKKSKDGSLRIGLVSNGKQYYFFVHKLVAMMFIDNPENKECVLHLDRDNKNNHYRNLVWATREEVQEMARLSQKLSGKIYELNNHRSRKCKMKKEDGTEIEYKSISEAGRKNNVDIENINNAVNGKYKKAYGMEWS